MSAELIGSLADELGQLWRSPRPSAAGLRKIARGVLFETLDADCFSDLMCQRRDGAGVTDSAILGRNLTAARVLAWAAADFVELQPRAEELVLAAFLADAAFFRPKQRRIRVTLTPESPEHVAIGAAFAAGIVDVPASLSQRVARHHERSDGTGFPRALKAAALSTDDRAVAVAVRFSELFEGSPLAAAKRLHHEARLGAFDPQLTRNLLWSLGGEFPAEIAFNERPPERWLLTDHGRRQLRIHAAHGSVIAPHFAGVRKSVGPAVPAG